MRLSKVAALALIVGAPSFFSASLARPASDCSISGTLADWGENSTGYIELKSGETCLFPIKMRGTVIGSDISQKPVHGKLKRLNISTFEYAAKARFRKRYFCDQSNRSGADGFWHVGNHRACDDQIGRVHCMATCRKIFMGTIITTNREQPAASVAAVTPRTLRRSNVFSRLATQRAKLPSPSPNRRTILTG